MRLSRDETLITIGTDFVRSVNLITAISITVTATTVMMIMKVVMVMPVIVVKVHCEIIHYYSYPFIQMMIIIMIRQ